MCEFTASGKPGVPPAPPVGGWTSARKREHQVSVRFAAAAETVETGEGPVDAAPGDAIITGAAGETWPVARAVFALRYRHLAGDTYLLPGAGGVAARGAGADRSLPAGGGVAPDGGRTGHPDRGDRRQ
ncbi:hypothetical protein HHL21_18675 [Massilia sp. RP-1-19]|uniref:Uncharacterized protein n=1 Tax=Massilia polaris TaxID=2728846 RepID=A0A848HQ11_9BURK|nr:PGDYG domain-containing protein [Massilia polaris]NML63067.1 hypothetical protein [Massilia polaris]